MRNKKFPKNYLLKYSLAFVITFRWTFLAMHARRNLPFTKGKQFAARRHNSAEHFTGLRH